MNSFSKQVEMKIFGKFLWVNSPYLFGLIFFFERMKNLIITEILSQGTIKEQASIISIIIQIASWCLHMGSKQSSYAILCGLCCPKIIQLQKTWLYFNETFLKENRTLYKLLNFPWKKKEQLESQSGVPLFQNFLELIAEILVETELKAKVSERDIDNSLCSIFTKISILPGRTLNKICQMSTKEDFFKLLQTCSFCKQESNEKTSSFKEELQILIYKSINDTLKQIEEIRKFYIFDLNDNESNQIAKQILLYKKY